MTNAGKEGTPQREGWRKIIGVRDGVVIFTARDIDGVEKTYGNGPETYRYTGPVAPAYQPEQPSALARTIFVNKRFPPFRRF